jgi:pilus assembly protein Flp/PilA
MLKNSNVEFITSFFERGLHMLFAPKEKGQGLVEYALILVLVAVVVIVILALVGPAIGNIFSNIITKI